MILMCPIQGSRASSYQIRPRVDTRQGNKEWKRASKTKSFTLNAAILVVVSARYSKGWIKGGAKIGRGRASPLTKASFRLNGHRNILMYMYCRRHMHLFKSCHSCCLFFWLNRLLLVIRWAIKGPWASSFHYNLFCLWDLQIDSFRNETSNI